MRNRLLLVLLLAVPAPLGLLVNCGDSSSGGTPDSGTTPTATTPAPTTTPSPTTTGTTPPPVDSGSDSGDLDSGADAARYCDLGAALGDAVGGTVRLFDKQGNPLPAGHYRITYVDGCMQYGGGQSFTVHAYEPNADASAYATWALVSSDAGLGGFQPVVLPGIWIFGADASAPDGGAFDSCVALNKLTKPVEFDYDAGAALGVIVNDSPLGDNVVGPDGSAPTWRLELFSASGVCP